MANGILDNQLPNSTLGLQGQTPNVNPGALKSSTLHNQSSLNNEPAIEQSPSGLDLDGLTPDKYLDNRPQ